MSQAMLGNIYLSEVLVFKYKARKTLDLNSVDASDLFFMLDPHSVFTIILLHSDKLESNLNQMKYFKTRSDL